MSRIREYVTIDHAESSRVRVAAMVDFFTAVVVAMLAFPFPIVRASVPTLVFVISILVSITFIHFLYLTITTPLFARTPGMYLMDLGFEGGGPLVSRSWRWALGSVVTFWPTVILGAPDVEKGLPVRMSGLVIGSTRESSSTNTPSASGPS